MGSRYIVVCGLATRKKWLRYLGYHTLPDLVDTYELWDLSAFCDKHDNAVSFDDEIEEGEHIHFIPDAESFRHRLRKLGTKSAPTYVFPLSTRPPQVIDIWRVSQNTNLRLCIKEHKDHPPSPFRSESLWGKGRRIKQKLQWSLKNARLSYRYGRPYRAFYAAPKFIGKWVRLDGFAPRDYIHNLNYDKVLDLDRRTPHEKSYAVYIDQNLPVDHQVQTQSNNTFISEENFWERMRKVFDRLTRQTEIDDIVVCAHPNRSKASLERLSAFCRVVQFETEKWIRDCSLVLAHTSTAIDFAVIFQKPVCFVAMPEMKRNGFLDTTEQYAKKLGRQVNILDGQNSPNLDFGRNETSYARFKNSFIKTPGTPEMNSWEYIVSVFAS